MSQKNWNDMTTEEQVDHAAKGLLDRHREQNSMSAVFKLPGGEHVMVTSNGKDSICEAFDTKQPRIPGYVAMNPDGSFTAVPSVGAPDLLRYCGDQPGDDWVKRVERLNGIIDGLNGRGRVCECKQAIVGTVVV